MRRQKDTVFYTIVIGVFSALMGWVIRAGKGLEPANKVAGQALTNQPWADFVEALQHSMQSPLAILLGQIVAIIVVARVLGWLCRQVGQPAVVGEMTAGILLGPSLLGRYCPEFSAQLFPAKSLDNIKFLSQIGLILFMFVVGMDLDLSAIRGKAQKAVVISHASIIIPFALGMSLAYFLYGSFAPAGVQFVSFSLFLGIAMSITAFPVLARIVQERGIHKTPLGTLVITCAAADDITAWCLLAAVVALVKAGSFVSAIFILALALGYVLVMLKVIRPALMRLAQRDAANGRPKKTVVAAFFLTMIASAFTAEVIGIHALFGAFLAGAIMPTDPKLRESITGKIRDVAVVLLLPLFSCIPGCAPKSVCSTNGTCGAFAPSSSWWRWWVSSWAARWPPASWGTAGTTALASAPS